MSYQRTTLPLRSTAPDPIPQDAPANAWNEANNIYFSNAGEAIRALGDTPFLTENTEARTMLYVRYGATGYFVYANFDGVFCHDGTNEFDITPAVWPISSTGVYWTMTTLGGIVYINRSDADPVYWDGVPTNICLPLPDWPASGRCVALRGHNNFLFAIGMTTEGPGQRVRWSDAAEPGTVPQFWTPAADNLAGFLDLAPASFACVDGVGLRDEFFIFKEEGVFALRFVGGNAVFAARQVFAEHGMRAPNGWCRGPDDELLVVGTDGDVFLCDGLRMTSQLDGRAQRRWYSSLTAQPFPILSGVYLAREKLGFLIAPNSLETGDHALVYDFSSGDIAFRQMPTDTYCAYAGELLSEASSNAWDADTDAWDNDTTQWNEVNPTNTIDDVFIGGAFGLRCISQNNDIQFVDGDIEALLSKTGISFGDAQRRKLVARLWPKIVGTEGDTIQFRIGAQEITGGPIQLADPVDFTIGQDDHIDSFITGRFLHIEVRSSGGRPWRMGTLDVEFRGVGDF